MEKDDKKLAKQKKKEERKRLIKEDKLKIKRANTVSKISRIQNEINDVIDYIDKNNLEIENKEKITQIATELKNVEVGLEQVQEDVEKSKKTTKKQFNIFGITRLQIFSYFIIYSFIGYVIETIFAFLAGGAIESRQSFLYGPFCAIYGLGAVVMIIGLQKFKRKTWTLILGGIILGAITEYLVSLIGELIFNVKWWDYSNMAFNLNGRICASYSLAWGGLGWLLLRYINPRVDRFLSHIPTLTLKTVTSVMMLLLLCDWLVSSFALEMFYIRLEDTHHIQLQQTSDNSLSRRIYNNTYVKAFVDTVWNDEVMVKTFPNLRVTTKNGKVIYVNTLYKHIKPYYVKVFQPMLFEYHPQPVMNN